MKNKLQLIAVVFTVSMLGLGNLNVQAQNSDDIVNIPDERFKAKLLAHNPTIDTNGDGEITVAEAEALEETLELKNDSIKSLTGLEAFKNIKKLLASYNQIEGDLDLSANTKLEVVALTDNKLTSVNVSQNAVLRRLGVNGNLLTSIDISNNPNIDRLWVYENQIAELNVSNNINLEHLVADHNKLTNIDLSNNTKLISVGIQFNQLKTLNVSSNTSLTVINAWDNQFESVNIANGNNANMTFVKFQNNPDLECVKIDEGFTPPTDGKWALDTTGIWDSNCTAGVEENNLQEKAMELYPNPAQDKITLNTKNLTLEKVTIYNVQGKEILVSEHSNINIANLNSGIYFITISTKEGNVFYEKLIKE